MVLTLSRRGMIRAALAMLLAPLAGCGMILHPERRGQPPGGGLDWSIVALDGLGLLIFFIPGVIAFAVDFATGAIYLPPEQYGSTAPPEGDLQFVEMHVPKAELTQDRLEQIASKHSGKSVHLTAGHYLTAPLTKLTDFWRTREKLATESV